MKIVPVLDLMSRQVVRGMAGERSRYRPIESLLAAGSTPTAIGAALAERFGFGEAYVADLDAIGGGQPDLQSYQALANCGLRLWIDAGLRTASGARRIAGRLDEAAVDYVLVAGLETLTDPEELAEMVAEIGASRLVFSLDLKRGVPLTSAAAWRGHSPVAIADEAIARGVARMILLDLANVGVQQGTSTLGLAREIRATHAAIELIGGGGVRSLDDLRSLWSAGFGAALVASALHDGRLTRDDIEELSTWDP